MFAQGANINMKDQPSTVVDGDGAREGFLGRSTMAMRGSIAIYPRPDVRFKGKKSVNFDMMRSQVFLGRPRPWYLNLCKWVAYLLLGIFTGCTAFLMETLETTLVAQRGELADKIMYATDGSTAQTYAFLAGWAILAGGIAAALTVNVGPGATGSGIAEIMAYLNGVNYPNLISW